MQHRQFIRNVVEHNASIATAPETQGFTFTDPVRLHRDALVAEPAFAFVHRMLVRAHNDKELVPDWPRTSDDRRLMLLDRGKSPLLDTLLKKDRERENQGRDTDASQAFSNVCLETPTILVRPCAFLELLSSSSSSSQPNGETKNDLKPPKGTPYASVLFTSERKTTPCKAVTDDLWAMDAAVLKHLQSNESIHLYVVMPLPNGSNYANLVLGRPLKDGETPMALMDFCPNHRSISAFLGAHSYMYATIHSGMTLLPEGFGTKELLEPASSASTLGVLRFTGTLFLLWGDDDPNLMDRTKPCPPVWRKRLKRDDAFPFSVAPAIARDETDVHRNWTSMFQEKDLTSCAMRFMRDAEQKPKTQFDEKEEEKEEVEQQQQQIGGESPEVMIGGSSGVTPPPSNSSFSFMSLTHDVLHRPAVEGAKASNTIRVTAYLGPALEPLFKDVATFLEKETGLRVEWQDWTVCQNSGGPYQALHQEKVDLIFMCGVQFARFFYLEQQHHVPPSPVSSESVVLGAPIGDFSSTQQQFINIASPTSSGSNRIGKFISLLERGGLPCYHSRLIVRKGFEEEFQDVSFEELRDKATFAFNERMSWSGYMVMENALQTRGVEKKTNKTKEEEEGKVEKDRIHSFFKLCVETGSHRESIIAVAEGRADVACIDAVVLEHEIRLAQEEGEGAEKGPVAEALQKIDLFTRGAPEFAPELEKRPTSTSSGDIDDDLNGEDEEENSSFASAWWPMPPCVASRRTLDPYSILALSQALHRYGRTPGSFRENQRMLRFLPVTAANYEIFAHALRRM